MALHISTIDHGIMCSGYREIKKKKKHKLVPISPKNLSVEEWQEDTKKNDNFLKLNENLTSANVETDNNDK